MVVVRVRTDATEHVETERSVVSTLEEAALRFLQWLHSGVVKGSEFLPMARWIKVVSISHMLVSRRMTCTKRDLYYMSVTLFGKQEVSNYVLESVASKLKIHRNDLNVVASPRGLLYGRVKWTAEDGSQIDGRKFSSQGVYIPSRPERLRCLEIDADWLLVKNLSVY